MDAELNSNGNDFEPRMNITEILKTKPHNPHYLKRYVGYLDSCVWKNKFCNPTYVESHHICPKANDLFPEYKDTKLFGWNAVKLTPEQHIFAHIILWKLFGGSQSHALEYFFRTKNFNKNHQRKIPTKLEIRYAAQARQESRKYISEVKIGTNIYNNGIEELFSKERPGIGWFLGRLERSLVWKEKQKDALKAKVFGAETYTDGVRNYFFKLGEVIPDHLTKGMKFRNSTTYYYVKENSVLSFLGKHIPPAGYETIKAREALSILSRNSDDAVIVESLSDAQELIKKCINANGSLNPNKARVYKRHVPKFRELLGIEEEISDATTVYCLLNNVIPPNCGICLSQVDITKTMNFLKYCSVDCWTTAKTGKKMKKTLIKELQK